MGKSALKQTTTQSTDSIYIFPLVPTRYFYFMVQYSIQKHRLQLIVISHFPQNRIAVQFSSIFMSPIILKNTGLYSISMLSTWVHPMFPQGKSSNTAMFLLQEYHQNYAVLLDASHLWVPLTCLLGSGANFKHLDILVFFKSFH